MGEPLRRFMAHVVIPHFTLFGWQVFLVEAVAGVLLLLGWHTRIGGVDRARAGDRDHRADRAGAEPVVLGIRALHRRQPVLVAVVPSNRHLSLDRRQGRA